MAGVNEGSSVSGSGAAVRDINALVVKGRNWMESKSAVIAIDPAKLGNLEKGHERYVDRIILKGSKDTYVLLGARLKTAAAKPGERFDIDGDTAVVQRVLPRREAWAIGKAFASATNFGDGNGGHVLHSLNNGERLKPNDSLGTKVKIFEDGKRSSWENGYIHFNTRGPAPFKVHHSVLADYEKSPRAVDLKNFARDRAVFFEETQGLKKEGFPDLVLALHKRGFDFAQISETLAAADFKNGLGDAFSAGDIERLHGKFVSERGGNLQRAEFEATLRIGSYFPRTRQSLALEARSVSEGVASPYRRSSGGATVRAVFGGASFLLGEMQKADGGGPSDSFNPFR